MTSKGPHQGNHYETPKTDYDSALEDLGEQPSKKKYYW